MQGFYHPRKDLFGPTSVPHVLGLTASPVVRTKVHDLESVSNIESSSDIRPNIYSIIERNLDSICRTPSLQRAEMLKFVHRPVVKDLVYCSHTIDEATPRSMALSLLRSVCRTVVPDAEQCAQAGQLSVKMPLPSGGYAEQLTKFRRKANNVYEQLGPWATDFFILESIKTLSESFSGGSKFLLVFKDDEKSKLLRVLNQIPLLMSSHSHHKGATMQISTKVECLISFLTQQDPERCSGLVFVKERATVAVLHALLLREPRTKDLFRCTTFVGLSNSAKRRYSMSELLDLKAQREALADFKAKVKNLIIATDVLEEGIDVTACNLVICFDTPSNLKSFLQRRGRARQEHSTFAILLDGNVANTNKIPSWQRLEEEMVQLYQDETRSLHNGTDEEDTEDVKFEISVHSTG